MATGYGKITGAPSGFQGFLDIIAFPSPAEGFDEKNAGGHPPAEYIDARPLRVQGCRLSGHNVQVAYRSLFVLVEGKLQRFARRGDSLILCL